MVRALGPPPGKVGRWRREWAPEHPNRALRRDLGCRAAEDGSATSEDSPQEWATRTATRSLFSLPTASGAGLWSACGLSVRGTAVTERPGPVCGVRLDNDYACGI